LKFFYFQNCVWIKKIKIVRVKENECKEKRRYDWCASKEKNIDAAWGVTGEPGHDDIHHHTRPQHSINGARHDLDPPRRRAPLLRNRQQWLLPWLTGVVLRVPLCPHLIDTPRAQTVFLEVEDHRCEGRVASSKTEFRTQVEERMKVIKEIHECFGRFFY